MNKMIAIPVLVGALALTGCSAVEGDTASKTDSAAEQTVPNAPDASAGTESDPWPLGEPVTVGEWEITINSWNPNANELVAAAGDDMSMLEDGKQYALLNATLAWNGEGTQPISTVIMDYLPTGGDAVSSAWTAFGTTPGENKLVFEDLVSGGSVTGDMLYTVDAGNVDGVFMLGAAAAPTVIQYAAVK